MQTPKDAKFLRAAILKNICEQLLLTETGTKSFHAKKAALKNLAKVTRKEMCPQPATSLKVLPTKVFS